MTEDKFVKKSITKLLLTGKGDNSRTKANMPEIIEKIGFYVGRIGQFGEKAEGGYTPDEVGELMGMFNKGFLDGYSN